MSRITGIVDERQCGLKEVEMSQQLDKSLWDGGGSLRVELRYIERIQIRKHSVLYCR